MGDKEVVGYVSLEFKGGVWAADECRSRCMRLDELTKEVNIAKKAQKRAKDQATEAHISPRKCWGTK